MTCRCRGCSSCRRCPSSAAAPGLQHDNADSPSRWAIQVANGPAQRHQSSRSFPPRLGARAPHPVRRPGSFATALMAAGPPVLPGPLRHPGAGEGRFGQPDLRSGPRPDGPDLLRVRSWASSHGDQRHVLGCAGCGRVPADVHRSTSRLTEADRRAYVGTPGPASGVRRPSRSPSPDTQKLPRMGGGGRGRRRRPRVLTRAEETIRTPAGLPRPGPRGAPRSAASTTGTCAARWP